jgi:hypothetical protein
MTGIDLEKARREQLRWYILETLNAARPVGANEDMVLSTIQAIPLPTTPLELRRELDYLEDRKLVTLSGKGGPVWFAELTRYGVDVVEYTIDCDPGIARPKKYW